jgi:hypothetical protein
MVSAVTCEVTQDAPVTAATADGVPVVVRWYQIGEPGWLLPAALAYSKNPAKKVVHLVPVFVVDGVAELRHPPGGRPGPLCGAFLGKFREDLAEGERICVTCPRRFEAAMVEYREAKAREAAERREEQKARREAELLSLGQVRAHVLHRADGWAEVALTPPVSAALSLIKAVPGRRWDRDLVAWMLPDCYTAELAESLRNLGVEVRETDQRPAPITRS